MRHVSEEKVYSPVQEMDIHILKVLGQEERFEISLECTEGLSVLQGNWEFIPESGCGV